MDISHIYDWIYVDSARAVVLSHLLSNVHREIHHILYSKRGTRGGGPGNGGWSPLLFPLPVLSLFVKPPLPLDKIFSSSVNQQLLFPLFFFVVCQPLPSSAQSWSSLCNFRPQMPLSTAPVHFLKSLLFLSCTLPLVNHPLPRQGSLSVTIFHPLYHSLFVFLSLYFPSLSINLSHP